MVYKTSLIDTGSLLYLRFSADSSIVIDPCSLSLLNVPHKLSLNSFKPSSLINPLNLASSSLFKLLAISSHGIPTSIASLLMASLTLPTTSILSLISIPPKLTSSSAKKYSLCSKIISVSLKRSLIKCAPGAIAASPFISTLPSLMKTTRLSLTSLNILFTPLSLLIKLTTSKKLIPLSILPLCTKVKNVISKSSLSLNSSIAFASISQEGTGLRPVPDALIRYYGYYSNTARGKRKKTSPYNNSTALINQTPTINDAPNRSSCRLSWARLIQQIYEVDPLLCPSCASTMKIIAFITDRIQII